jgi:hypothetical protein
VSNDGKVCQWSFGKLNEPIVNFNLKIQGEMAQQSEAIGIGVTSMHFPEGESDKFYAGSDDFCMYQCNFHQTFD